MSELGRVLAKIETWDGDIQEPYNKWMGELKNPIHKNELLDVGMDELIPLMNIDGKIYTLSSCMHDPAVYFAIMDDTWFTSIALPAILAINNDDFIMRLKYVYFGRWGSTEPDRPHWVIEPACIIGWWESKESVLNWYKACYLAFEQINS